MSKKFFINHKREFLITYAEDFGGVLTLTKIFDFFSKFGVWEIITCEESGHESGDKHEHFHVYLNYIGNNKNGFSTREQKIWDIPLLPTAIKLQLGPNYFYVTNDLFQLHKNEYVFDSFKEFKYAHPNIKFKGDKEDINCENTEKMIKYVTKQTLQLNKQDWKIYSNFDWEKRLEDIQKNKLEKKNRFTKKNKNGQEVVENNKDNLEYSFCCWLRSIVMDGTHKTITQIKRIINEDEEKSFVYYSKYHNYSSLLIELCTHRDVPKPKVNYEFTFIVPVVLYNYLLYLNEFIKNWFTDKSKCEHRPKGLWMTGDSRCGKTTIIAMMGPFSYFKNMWNALDYETDSPFNVMDDFDIIFEKPSDFNSFKPWVGAQDTITISDKWVKKMDIINGKPLIWLNNNTLNDQCPNLITQNYIKKNMIVVELGCTDLYNKKNTSSIGGFCNWREWNPKNTWYYQNILSNNNENVIEISSEVNINTNTNNNKEENVILIKDDPEAEIVLPPVENIPAPNSNILGRRKRKNNWIEQKIKKSSTRSNKKGKEKS